jgi:hypothetical protein
MPKFILDRRFPIVMRALREALRPWPWCLIGGRAVEVWTNPPQTPDVDVLAAVEDEHEPLLTARMAKAGVALNDRATGLGSPMLFYVHKRTRVEADVLGAYEPMHYAMIRESVRRTVQATRFRVAHAEGVVMLKAQAAVDVGRPVEKRSRDRRAILAVASSVRLKKHYIRQTLAEHQWTEEAALLRLLRVI